MQSIRLPFGKDPVVVWLQNPFTFCCVRISSAVAVISTLAKNGKIEANMPETCKLTSVAVHWGGGERGGQERNGLLLGHEKGLKQAEKLSGIKINYCRSRSRSVCCPSKNGREMI